MSTPTVPSPAVTSLYPPEGFGAPKHRQGHASADGPTGLPQGTEIFSADNHISVADDIFYERFPEELKGAAPRIWYEDGAYMVGMKGKAWTGGDFGRVLMQYDDLAGAALGAGVEVAGFSLGQPSLDEVFLALTGHPAEDAEEVAA